MKKLITIIALVLTVALCSSFAIGATTNKVTVTPNGNPASTNVVLNYTAATTDETTVVYSVDVEWKDVAFAYNAGSTQWNPATHNYTASVNKGWTDTSGSVKVTNHSNAAVSVEVAYEAANAEVDVTINDADAESNGLVKTVELESAVNTAYNEAPNATAILTASILKEPTAGGTVGTITVTVSAATSN